MSWVLKRLKERSTWSALVTLAGIVGLKIRPDLQEGIITAIVAVVAVIAAITADPPKAAAIADKVIEKAEVVCEEPTTGAGQTITSPPLSAEQREATGMDR